MAEELLTDLQAVKFVHLNWQFGARTISTPSTQSVCAFEHVLCATTSAYMCNNTSIIYLLLKERVSKVVSIAII